jgi:hypothetical protein
MEDESGGRMITKADYQKLIDAQEAYDLLRFFGEEKCLPRY